MTPVWAHDVGMLKQIKFWSSVFVLACVFGLAIAFVVGGHPVIAVLYEPLLVVYGVYLLINIAFALTAKRDERTSAWLDVIVYGLWFLCLLGGYLHPTEGLQRSFDAHTVTES